MPWNRRLVIKATWTGGAGGVGGPARFSGASVAPAVTPKMCQRQQTLNTALAAPLLLPPPPVVDHVAQSTPPTHPRPHKTCALIWHWQIISHQPSAALCGIKGNQPDGLNLTPTKAESWRFNHSSSLSNRRPSWGWGWKLSSVTVKNKNKKDKINGITFEGCGWKKRRWIKKKLKHEKQFSSENSLNQRSSSHLKKVSADIGEMLNKSALDRYWFAGNPIKELELCTKQKFKYIRDLHHGQRGNRFVSLILKLRQKLMSPVS